MHTKQQMVINNNTAEGPLIQNAILWLGPVVVGWQVKYPIL